MFFVFGSTYVEDYVYRLAYVEPALHFWDEADFVVMDKLYDVLLQSVCQSFIEYVCICVHHEPEVFFSC